MKTTVPYSAIPAFQKSRIFSILLAGLLLASTANASPFDVRFLSFTTIEVNSDIQIKWRTVEEDDIKNYYVERCSDGNNWENIGCFLIKADVAHNDYELLDKNPANNTGWCYYRIKAETIDGRISYSMTRSITVNNNLKLVLFPVPAKNTLQIQVKEQSTDYEPGLLCVADATGKILTTLTIYPASDTYRTSINISDYKPGFYMVSIQNSIVRWTGRFIKE